MSDSLKDFLQPKKLSGKLEASGSFQCSECDEIIHNAMIDEQTMIMSYICNNKHVSEIQL